MPELGNSLVVTEPDTLALDILRRAQEQDVPLRSDPALTGALASLDIGMSLPPEMFRAVAEALAFVSLMNGR